MTADAPSGRDAARRADVVVIGDGPAGTGLAAACVARGIDVLLVGRDEPWAATYTAWADELDEIGSVPAGAYAARLDSVVAYGARRHRLDRPYGVLDNGALRSTLRAGVPFVAGEVEAVATGLTHHSVLLAGGERIRCRQVVDATGRPARFAPAGPSRTTPAWQTALGVVLAKAPPGELGTPTLMDLRQVPDTSTLPASVPTFAYSLPVHDGWLVEETVLAARPAIEPAQLGGRLAARLGSPLDELLGRAVRTESVRIPMGGPAAAGDQPIVAFGAAAGYVNPATGYSVAASLRAAARVADAIEAALTAPYDLVADWRTVRDAVWPADLLRTRALHDYGLELLVRLDAPELREFFDLFFELPVGEWSPYLRVDASPAEVTRTMRRLFRSASWPMRRRLAAGNPLPLARLLRR